MVSGVKGDDMDYGVVLDLETTGLDWQKDRIIEIGLVSFAIRDNDPQPQIVNVYSSLQDPEIPLDPLVTKITGLTDDIVRGRRIDWDYVKRELECASIVVAHNAGFDSKFISRIPQLQNMKLHWGCTLRHIDWKAKGFKTMNLSYLAADNGFLNPFAHRAVFDCATTFRLMGPHIHELVENSFRKWFKICAINAPFSTKDVLKERGYFWDANQRFWYKIIGEHQVEAEKAFLQADVYGNNRFQAQFIEEPAFGKAELVETFVDE
jgi:DNA polymerase-3 subunit epsilon